MINIGYVGLNTGLVTPNKTFRLASYTNDKMIEYTARNLEALMAILQWNKKNNIYLFRITSGLVPFGSAKINNGSWKTVFNDEFRKIGDFIKLNNMRVSMHPGQYTVLNSPVHTFYENSLLDLGYHNSILELMGLDKTHRIIIHGGGVYGNKEPSKNLLLERLKILPANVYKRLALENDERNFNLADILSISNSTNIPIVFDVFHDEILPSLQLSLKEKIELAAKTWPWDERQKIHYSNQEPGKNKGAHSQTINLEKFMIFYEKIKDLELDIMLEVKDKERSVLKIKNKLSAQILMD